MGKGAPHIASPVCRLGPTLSGLALHTDILRVWGPVSHPARLASWTPAISSHLPPCFCLSPPPLVLIQQDLFMLTVFKFQMGAEEEIMLNELIV